MNHQLDPSRTQSRVAGDVPGAAALSICESMLIALNDRKILNDKDARDVLADAAQSHRSAAPESTNAEMHLAVATLIEKIMNGENSVRRI